MELACILKLKGANQGMKKQTGSGDAEHLFRQVYEHMISRINRREWHAHEKLPSIRQLASELQVHRLTVFRAYKLLQQNGKAYAKEKSGYYASPDHPEPLPDMQQAAAPFAAPNPVKNDMYDIQRRPVTYQFSQALIDPGLLPNLYLSEYVKKVFDIYPKLMGTYSPAQGDEELRGNLSQSMSRQLRVQLHPNELLIASGAQQAIDLLARLYIRPLDAVLVERPTYSVALDIFRQQGARLVPVDIRPDGYDLDSVEMLMKQYKPRFFYMNPTFHNPTGFTVPSNQRKQLVELAERYRCLLIEDDAFHEMYFDEPPPLPFFTYDTEGWVVYLRSFSKYIAPGLRICAIAGRQNVIEPLITAKSLADNGTPIVNQKIFLHYFASERMQQHLAKLRIALQIRRNIMEEELAAAGWEWTRPNGGLNLWLKLPYEIRMDRFLNESIRQSVSFVPGNLFDPLGTMPSRIRLSYSFISEYQIRSGVKRLVDIAQRSETG